MSKYLSIKDSAIHFSRSEMTIRRLVKKIQQDLESKHQGIQIIKKEQLPNGSFKTFILTDYLNSVYVDVTPPTYTNDSQSIIEAKDEHIASLKAQIEDLIEAREKDRIEREHIQQHMEKRLSVFESMLKLKSGKPLNVGNSEEEEVDYEDISNPTEEEVDKSHFGMGKPNIKNTKWYSAVPKPEDRI